MTEQEPKEILRQAVSQAGDGARPFDALQAAEAGGVDRRVARDALQGMITSGELQVGWDRRLHVAKGD